MTSEKPNVDEELILDKALKEVRRQNYFIMLEIERNNLRFCLKQTFTLLCELRTDFLKPKNYQILYNHVVNELIQVHKYMNEEISFGREPWDIYESVQQCRYVIPRLYLTIIAGSVYLEHSPEKCKELIEDLLDIVKQAQSPLRTIFVRYFLTKVMARVLPDEDNKDIKEGCGTILDTIYFLIKNLEEMNRAWIRMTLNASLDEKPILEKERLDIKMLIKDAIYIISKLKGMNNNLFEKEILPKIIEIIFMYDDYISQEFIMECILTDFPESYIIKNLDFLLLTLSKLGEGVDKKKLFVIVLEKLFNYYKNNIENKEGEEKEKILNEVHGAYPVVLRNFNIILQKQEKSVQNLLNILEINYNFIKFCVYCAPEEEKLISINHGLNSTYSILISANVSILFQDQLNKIHDILSIPLESIYSIFDMANFPKLFSFLDYQNKKKLAFEIIDNLTNVNSHEKLDTLEKIKQLIIFLRPLEKNLDLNNNNSNNNSELLIEKEQFTLIKIFSVFKTKNIDLLFQFYFEFKNLLIEGDKSQRNKSLPCLISILIIFCKDISYLYSQKIEQNEKYDISSLKSDEDFYNYLSNIYSILSELIKKLEQDDQKMAFKYSFLIMRQINIINTAKEKFGEIYLSLFNNSFELYKNFEQEKKFEYFKYICQYLMIDTIFSEELYEKILDELINEAKNMQKRSEQCNGLLTISKIYFVHFKNGEKVLEYLSKAKKIADFSLTNQKNLILFVNLLNEYLYYIDSDKENIVKIEKDLIEEIIEYIQNYFVTIKMDKNNDLNFLNEIENYYNNTINLINERKNKEEYNEIYKFININSDNQG